MEILLPSDLQEAARVRKQCSRFLTSRNIRHYHRKGSLASGAPYQQWVVIEDPCDAGTRAVLAALIAPCQVVDS